MQLGIAEEIDPSGIKGGDQLYQTAWNSTRYIDGKYYGVSNIRANLRAICAQGLAREIRPAAAEKLG
ncbi:Uncharacterised protein [Raoultella terrigena]|uniref:Uncharacterized protein n=1 Tax=Raoultella terrigena TaxID=577 RepID=A0A3P8JSW2_RAOTE|nr:Uncharacterised protein [Raoultella terrigena]